MQIGLELLYQMVILGKYMKRVACFHHCCDSKLSLTSSTEGTELTFHPRADCTQLRTLSSTIYCKVII